MSTRETFPAWNKITYCQTFAGFFFNLCSTVNYKQLIYIKKRIDKCWQEKTLNPIYFCLITMKINQYCVLYYKAYNVKLHNAQTSWFFRVYNLQQLQFKHVRISYLFQMAYFILIKETHFNNLLYLPLQKGFKSP